ncbi:MAG TPA: LacI family DNA-binding transcriptional regulator [Streptosporangiaceae bacterium]|jgi:LacI family transcriptional regulator|nr:LacI family DNA-binding transcriptional regulator [Streptosporangiaceae bacterium]
MKARSVVTLSDVAERAGVSLATASRVINGGTRAVSPHYRDRVLAAAADLGYTPNAHAQAMARGRSKMIGLVVHDIADPYFSAIAAGAISLAGSRGLLVLGNTLHNPDYEFEYVATMRAQRAQALILVGSRTTDVEQTRRLTEEVTEFIEGGGRVAAVSQATLGADTVLPENRAGAQALAEALIGEGHRRFAVLGGPPTLLTARDRVAGFADALAGNGLEPPVVIEGAFTRDGGYAAMTELLDRPGHPPCVFAVNDVMAIGAMAAVRERGLRVPGDIAVAGFDDIPTLRDVAPSLTTVRLPLAEMGRLAASMVLDDEPGPSPRVAPIAGEVVLRESTIP